MMYPDSWLQERCEASGKRCSYNIISDAALLPPSSLARPCQPLKFKDAICAAVSCTAPPRTTLLIFSSVSSNNCYWRYIRVGNFCSEGNQNQCIFMSSSMLHVTQQFSVCSAPSVSQSVFTITEKAPTKAFSWLKAPTSTFTFKTLC